MIKLAIYASGSGTNAQAIMDHFRDSTKLQVALLVSNNPEAYALVRAQNAGIPTALLSQEELPNAEAHLEHLKKYDIGLIALGGWLKLIPADLVKAYPNRILNIHPSLLPAFGGRGMFGLNVHRAVVASGVAESGCTIHLVNEHYDEGLVLAQAKLKVDPTWTPEELQQAVLKLEHQLYTRTLETYTEKLV